MNVMHQQTWTRDSFIDWVECQEAPYEFDGIAPIPMNGGTFNHALIGQNIVFSLRTRLAGRGLVVFGAGAGIATSGGAVRFPDAFVTATKPAGSTRLMPGAIVAFEVISPSTQRTDRMLKPREYGAVPSLRHYVIVEQAFVGLSAYSRPDADTPWTMEAIAEIEAALPLPALGTSLPLREIYDGVDLP